MLRCTSLLLCRFSDAWMMPHPCTPTAGVGKAPRHEIAGGGAAPVQRRLWGFGRGRHGWDSGLLGSLESVSARAAVADRPRSSARGPILLLGGCCEPGTRRKNASEVVTGQ